MIQISHTLAKRRRRELHDIRWRFRCKRRFFCGWHHSLVDGWHHNGVCWESLGVQVFQEIFGAQIVFLGLHLRFQYVPMYFRRVIFWVSKWGCWQTQPCQPADITHGDLVNVTGKWRTGATTASNLFRSNTSNTLSSMLHDVTWSFLKEALSVQMSPLRTCRALFVPLA